MAAAGPRHSCWRASAARPAVGHSRPALSRPPNIVSWTDFSQDNRPAWDYSDFGPFTFCRRNYDQAVRATGTPPKGDSA